jgi:hypothetical protein
MARNTRTMHSWYLRRFPIVSARPAAFSPASISNLAFWVDAADASTLTLDGSNNVEEWRDKSGAARHLTQATTTLRPAYVTGALNGNPVVRIDGIDDVMLSPTQTAATWYGSGTQQITWMAIFALVAQNPSQNNIAMGLNTAIGGGTNRLLIDRQPVAVGTTDALLTAAGTTQYITSAPQAGTAWFIETIRWTNGGTPTMRRTNTAGTNTYNGLGTLTGTMADNQRVVLGYGTTLPANFSIAEKVIYARNLSDTEVAQIETAWLAKWGTI